MASSPLLKALGLNFSPNPIDLPPGSLTEASNIIIKRDDVIESRRGYKVYDSGFGSSVDRAKQLAVYKDRILVHFANKLAYEDGTTDANGLKNLQNFFGNYSETQDGLRIKSIEANGNFYFTTSEGVDKISAATADDFNAGESYVVHAGVPKGVDFVAEPTYSQGNITGFLPANSTTAYKIVWGTKDKNNNLILGTPSQRFEVYNYLMTLLLQDYVKVLGALDDLFYETSTLITDVNYLKSLWTNNNLSLNSNTTTLRNNIVLGLVPKLDADIKIASSSFPTGRPLIIDEIAADSTVGTINFNLNEAFCFGIKNEAVFTKDVEEISIPSNELIIGDWIYFTGLDSLTGNNIKDNVPYYVKTVVGDLITISDNPSTPTNTPTWSGGSPTITASAVKFENGEEDHDQIVIKPGSLNLFEKESGGLHNLKEGDNVVLGCTGTISGLSAETRNLYVLADGLTRTTFKLSYEKDRETLDTPISFTGNLFVRKNRLLFKAGSSPIQRFSATNTVQIDFETDINFTQPLTTSLFSLSDRVSLIITTTHPGYTGYYLVDSTYSDASVNRITLKPQDFTISSDGSIPSSDLKSSVVFCKDSDIYFSESGAGSSIKLSGVSLDGTDISGDYSVVKNKRGYINIAVPTGTTITYTEALIGSNTFGSITPVPTTPTNDESNQDQQELKEYLEQIILALNSLPTGIVSTYGKSLYLSSLATTASSNVKLTITIPPEITDNYFFQVYRSANVTTAEGASLFPSDVSPGTELKLAYEAYPTTEELNASEIIIEDSAPDTFLEAYLYTNEINGLGISQSNDVPPFAKDINVFKNVTFYANTRTRHRLIMQFFGVNNLLTQIDENKVPKITITRQDGDFNTYSFVKGLQHTTEISFVGAISGSTANGKYFTINSANNEKEYYVWFNLNNTATDPGLSVSALSGKTGIEVKLIFATTQDLVDKLTATLSQYVTDFIVELFEEAGVFRVTIINLDYGYCDPVTAGDMPLGFNITTTQSGQGERVNQQITEISCTDGSSLDGVYFLINSTYDQEQYYVWYNTGSSSDPNLLNRVGIEVNIQSTYDQNEVAESTEEAIDTIASNQFITDRTANILTITNKKFGPCTDASDETSGFGVSVIQTGALDVLVSDIISTGQAVDETARSLVRVINKNDSETLNAYYLSEATDVPGKFYIESQELNTPAYNIIANNTLTGQSFSPDISPYFEIVNIVSSVAGEVIVDCGVDPQLSIGDKVVISGSSCSQSIDGTHEVISTLGTTFTIQADITSIGSEITGGVTKVNFASVTDNDDRPNRVYYSKLNEPEAVPIANYFDVGARDRAILRIFPLRDTLFVFKEDGLYRISGETAPFTLSLFDTSCVLTAPDSVAVSSNYIFCWTTKGITTVTESGASVISRPIDTEILKVSSSDYTNFKNATFGIGYDSDNSYTVFTVKNTTDTTATVAYRFSTLTNSWTSFGISKTCGIVKFFDDRVYLGASDINSVEQERKSFNRTDYADREYILETATSGTVGNKIKLSSAARVAVGDVLSQETGLTIFTFNALLEKLDKDPDVITQKSLNPPSSDYIALKAAQGDNLRNKITDLATKLDSDGVTVGLLSVISTKTQNNALVEKAPSAIITTSTAHGLITGRKINVTGNTSVFSLNGTHTVTKINDTKFSVPVTVKDEGNGILDFVTADQNFEDIKTCYNYIIQSLNLSNQAAFSDYSSVAHNTKIEVVVTDVDYSTNVVTVNLALDFVQGPITLYKAIKTKFTYAPNHFGDPLSFKHFRELTMMFLNKAFTNALVRVGTDLLPQLIEVPFNGDGNGLFGLNTFGQGFFGGNSHPAPFRTYIPRQCQRCRYIVVQFEHNVAREQYGVTGMTLTGEAYSIKAYR